MNPRTNVRRHPRKGTRGVKSHSREVDSADANRVPHDEVHSDDLNLDEEESEEEEDQKSKKEQQDGLLETF